MNYEQYKAYAKAKGFQALSETAFKAMVKAGFNFLNGKFE